MKNHFLCDEKNSESEKSDLKYKDDIMFHSLTAICSLFDWHKCVCKKLAHLFLTYSWILKGTFLAQMQFIST